jgi:6-phosphofructokinase 1
MSERSGDLVPAVQRVGVLTSGGDAPGMNAAIRAVVRTCVSFGIEAVGIERGFHGLIHDQMRPLDARSVSGIIYQGGTMLRTARSEEFRTPEGRARAIENMGRHGIDGLVAIGGNGTYSGAKLLASECDVRVIGVPGTIDNDVPGTLYTIGFDTAVNTALDCIDRIRDTSEAFERVFVVEVMGRDAGFIAMESGLAGGAEAVLVPELPVDMEALCRSVERWQASGKKSCIIVVAEGAASGAEVAACIERGTGVSARLTVLGYIQRGGRPTARDRSLATRLGYHAVKLLAEGQRSLAVGIGEGENVSVCTLDAATSGRRALLPDMGDVATVTAG